MRFDECLQVKQVQMLQTLSIGLQNQDVKNQDLKNVLLHEIAKTAVRSI